MENEAEKMKKDPKSDKFVKTPEAPAHHREQKTTSSVVIERNNGFGPLYGQHESRNFNKGGLGACRKGSEQMNQNERDEIVRLFEAQRQLQRADAVPERLNELGMEENMEDGEEDNGRHNVPWLGHMEEEMEDQAYDSGRSSIEEMEDGNLQEINGNVDFARPNLKRRHDPMTDPCDAQLKRQKTEEAEMDENTRDSDRRG
ncbi:hypothetical protein B9Z55_026120 [Caenorhabditis nigoni]|uniref:Uncharacterized protein n=1 Tax=Caenorhabditis nigoni TaxID=1611254 RepID=A0A2G5T1P5_9PELO|nr:hypothetical protein B9Z55_026120 [Caenorhabditis nigoni]